ncbi:MAG: B12-binding domain-containing radical SAM protein [Oscillospiraceae bacterium]|nr:B12-binding domain-containing radical SAM protein [Oscillospiraceae bacterium]
MNVLLVNPNIGFQPSTQPAPLGLLSIGTYLKQRGCHVRLYDRNVDKMSLEKVLQAFQPDAAGVSVISTKALDDGAGVSCKLRALGIPVIWGGQMASAVPELILRQGIADYVVIGEGEVSFYALLQAIEQKQDMAQVDGVAYLDAAGSACRTPERPFAELAEFPVTDWSLADPRKYMRSHMCCSKMMFLYLSKGCPCQCTFCSNESFHHCKYRKRPNGHVLAEIKELATKYGLNGVEFADELFGVNKRELYEFCDSLREMKLDFVWGCSTRLSHLKREDLQYMYDAGCRWIFYGVESGSPDMLKRIKKGIDPEIIGKEFAICGELGIAAYAGFIIGLPDETEDQLRATVQLMLALGTTFINTLMFYPIPGSALYNELVGRKRLVPPETLRDLGTFSLFEKKTVNYSNVPTRDLYVVQSCFHWRGFFGKNSAKNMKKHEFAQKTIVSSLRQITKQGILNMVKYLFSSARMFLMIAWYANAYPGIRRKYGLS